MSLAATSPAMVSCGARAKPSRTFSDFGAAGPRAQRVAASGDCLGDRCALVTEADEADSGIGGWLRHIDHSFRVSGTGHQGSWPAAFWKVPVGPSALMRGHAHDGPGVLFDGLGASVVVEIGGGEARVDGVDS